MKIVCLYALILPLFFLIETGHTQQLALITIGDSLTSGSGDDQYDANGLSLGYPGRLKNSLNRENTEDYAVLSNIGVAGYSSSNLIVSPRLK